MTKNIIFDFDGVILDSVPVKTEAFKKLFEAFGIEEVNRLIKYHLDNGGKSRYLKIKYFFNEILKEEVTQEKVQDYALKYSELTKQELSKKKYLISDTLNFIYNNYKKYNFHVASGADNKDLQYICHVLNLNQYFVSIEGSPTVKTLIVKNILSSYKYTDNETILIGDSINDYDASDINNLRFYGYNNKELKNLPNSNYIDTMSTFDPEH